MGLTSLSKALASELEKGFSVAVMLDMEKRVHCDKCGSVIFYFEPTWKDENGYLVCVKCRERYKISWGRSYEGSG